jgi:hypothetical protein
LATGYFATRAYPRAVLQIAYTRAKVWDVAALDMLLVSDDIAPSIAAGGAAAAAVRGFTDVLMQATEAQSTLPATKESDAERGRISYIATKKDGGRYSYWSPAAQVNTVDGTGLILTCNDHEFSGDESGVLKDVQWFDEDKAGELPEVTIYPVGNYAARITRFVSGVSVVGGVDSSTMTVTVAVALTPPLVVEHIDYDDADVTDEQKTMVNMSDGDHTLDGDVPYKYT